MTAAVAFKQSVNALAGTERSTDPTVAQHPGHITAPTQSAGSTTTGSGGGLSSSQQSAYATAQQLLSQWGLSDLASQVRQWIVQGESGDELTLLIQQTPEYQQRYGVVNDARIAAGLQPLTAAQQLGIYEQYRQTLEQYGMPQGYWDNDQAMQKLMIADISPSELADRAKMASDLVNGNPETLQMFNQYYGTQGSGGAVAALLDPNSAEPILQNQISAAGIGGAAAQQGLNIDQGRAYQLAQSGASLSQAQQGYNEIKQRMATDQANAARFGTTFNQTDEENTTFLNDADATQRKNLIDAEESAQFGGHGSSAAGSTNDAGTGSI